MEWSEFRNCSGFSDEQITTIVLTRGIMAALCCAVLFTVLILLATCAKCSFEKVCGTVVKRLVVGLTVATLLYQLFLAIPEIKGGFCQVDGFLEQYFGSIMIYFILTISLVLFSKVIKGTKKISRKIQEFFTKAKNSNLECCNWKINKFEIALYISILILPLLHQWIPFATHSYGPFAAWCWIRKYEKNCSFHRLGMVERIALWAFPFMLVTTLMFAFLITSLCLIGYAKVKKIIEGKVQAIIYDSLLSLSLVFGFCALQGIVYSFALTEDSFVFWILYALLLPLANTFIPLALLITIHLPFSSTIARLRHKFHRQDLNDTNNEQPTFPASSPLNQPSHTTWHTPHSSYESSKRISTNQQHIEGGEITE